MEFDLNYYDLSYYQKKIEQYERGEAWKVNPFFEGLTVENKTVLDYGSAAGNMAKEAMKRNAKTIVAYDPIYDAHPEILEAVQINGINFLTTNELRQIEDKFDLVFCSDVIEHVVSSEVKTFVDDLVNFANTPSIICINSPVKINLAWLIGRSLASSTIGHINVMSPWKVISLFRNHQFKLINKPRVLGISRKKIFYYFEKLPYPLNSLWGGHYFMRFTQSV